MLFEIERDSLESGVACEMGRVAKNRERSDESAQDRAGSPPSRCHRLLWSRLPKKLSAIPTLALPDWTAALAHILDVFVVAHRILPVGDDVQHEKPSTPMSRIRGIRVREFDTKSRILGQAAKRWQ